MEIRELTRTEIFQVAELEKECFSDPWSETAFESELNNPLSLWLVAVDGDVVAGYVGSQTVLDESDMMNIAVLPGYRRQGIAQELIEALILRLNEKNAKSLSLEVRASNEAAILLYKKLGFVQVGCRRGYYRNPKEDAYILRKEWA